MSKKGDDMGNRNLMRCTVILCAVALVSLGAVTGAFAKDEETPSVTFDGLELVPDTKVAVAYVRPGADFGGFNRVMIQDAEVAFRQGWERDQLRSVHRITSRDITQIKEGVADMLREVFVEVLEANDGYEVVSKPAADVLLLRPAVIDLDITAPDNPRAGRSTTFVSSAGAATLFLELKDSVSGEILARFVDRQGARDFGHFQHSNRVRNSSEGRRIMRGWAELLRQGLDEIHNGGGKTAEP